MTERRKAHTMTHEVELKFPLPEAAGVQQQLQQLGARQLPAQRQTDRYFNHPSRDFATTDEALRIRICNETCRITWKGPVLDTQVKMRREIELQVGETAEDAVRLAELLVALGFREVRSVCKQRTPWQLQWEGQAAEVVFDSVDGLGEFVELELLATDGTRDAAAASVLRLAGELGLEGAERRSYLRMLLEQDSGN